MEGRTRPFSRPRARGGDEETGRSSGKNRNRLDPGRGSLCLLGACGWASIGGSLPSVPPRQGEVAWFWLMFVPGPSPH